jgi:hypothetical protein
VQGIPSVQAMTRTKLFISYSHKDRRWLDRVREQLDVLEREGLIDPFEDKRIGVGEDWYARLDREMREARIALLLISASFLTSAFIRKKEISRLFGQHETGGMVLYPLLVRDCAWQEVSWLTRLQIRPADARPIAGMRSATLDKCLADVAREIASIVKAGADSIRSEPPVPHDAASNATAQFKAQVEQSFEEGQLSASGYREVVASGILQEAYRDSRVESVRSQLIHIHAETQERETFLPSQAFPILRGLFVERNTFTVPIRDCRDEKWMERFIATVETRRLTEMYRPVLIAHAKPGDEQLVRSYDELNLHRFLQELTGLFDPRPGVNEIIERLRKADVDAVKQELRQAEIHPKGRIEPKTIRACDRMQSAIRKIWEQWPII